MSSIDRKYFQDEKSRAQIDACIHTLETELKTLIAKRRVFIQSSGLKQVVISPYTKILDDCIRRLNSYIIEIQRRKSSVPVLVPVTPTVPILRSRRAPTLGGMSTSGPGGDTRFSSIPSNRRLLSRIRMSNRYL